MKVDTNTNGHRQWFYFSVRNLMPSVVKFNIYRFKKKFSLFQRGMKPYVLSMKSKSGWKPGCTKISYKTEKFTSDQNQTPTYYLSFQYKFEFPEDEVYFASGIPYPVSFLNKRLGQFQALRNPQIQLDITTIGKTLCGQDMQLIQISPRTKSVSNYIIINARTHAGETSSSWVLDGLLQKLLTDDSIKRWVNENNIYFKIIPMLNPDGVFVGNYRTGILGEDFNRKFATGKKELFPEIHLLKKVISDCKKNGKVLLFLDLHGHSVLKNSFIYGPSETLFTQHPLRNLPFTIWHQSKYFRLSSCKFKFSKDMNETARIYFQFKENILTYTCEISLGLYFQGNNTLQMLEEDYKSLGSSIITSMLQLLTKQKVNNFQTVQQNLITLERLNQAHEPSDHSKSLVKQQPIQKQADRGQTKMINKREKQRDRETCLEKIKNIKKQLQEEQKSVKREYTSVQQDKSHKSINKTSLNKRKMQLNCSIEGATDKLNNKNNNKFSFIPRKGSTFDPFQLGETQTQQDGSPIKATRIQQKKAHREAQFKIRRKSEINRILPESLRKKLGPKIELGFTSTKHFKGEQQSDEFLLERSATYDSPYLSTQIQRIAQIQEQQCLDIINQKFSQEYESINDSDNSSEDLCDKQRQYLIECIKNNKKLKTNENDEENQQDQEEQIEETGNSTNANINGFKQIRFKSIEAEAARTIFPLRNTKRDAHKFRDLTHKSLGRNLYEQEGVMMPQMVQKKQLNERINKKNIREPYFLVQIKNKNH